MVEIVEVDVVVNETVNEMEMVLESVVIDV